MSTRLNAAIPDSPTPDGSAVLTRYRRTQAVTLDKYRNLWSRAAGNRAAAVVVQQENANVRNLARSIIAEAHVLLDEVCEARAERAQQVIHRSSLIRGRAD